ncbi:MAG: hypothetical protein R2751_11340 [Bacteroidales bacterium]
MRKKDISPVAFAVPHDAAGGYRGHPAGGSFKVRTRDHPDHHSHPLCHDRILLPGKGYH